MTDIKFEISKFGGPYIKAVFDGNRLDYEKRYWEEFKKDVDDFFTKQEKSKT